MNNPRKKNLLVLTILVLLYIITHIPYLLFWDIGFDSDYALIGLMANHFSKGEYYSHFWGVSYLGTIEPFLTSIVFRILGSSQFTINIIPFILSIILIILNYYLISLYFNKVIAIISSLLLIFSSHSFIMHTLRSLGTYIETLVIGTILIIVFSKIEQNNFKKIIYYPLLGFFVGLGYWENKLIIFYIVGIFLYLFFKTLQISQNKSFVTNILNLFLLRGYSLNKYLYYSLVILNILNLFNLLSLLFIFIGEYNISIGLFKINTKIYPGETIFNSIYLTIFIYMSAFILHSINISPRKIVIKYLFCIFLFVSGFIIGYLPEIISKLMKYKYLHNDTENIIATLKDIIEHIKFLPKSFKKIFLFDHCGQKFFNIFIIFNILIGLGYTIYLFLKNIYKTFSGKEKLYKNTIFVFILISSVSIFILSSRTLSVEYSRYLFPIYPIITLSIGLFLYEVYKKSKFISISILIFIIFFYVRYNIDLFINSYFYRHRTFYPIINFLKYYGIKGGYADYWINYAIVFLTNEEIILSPYDGNNYYPEYTEYVSRLDKIAVIMPENKKLNDLENIINLNSYSVILSTTVGNKNTCPFNKRNIFILEKKN